MEFLRKTLVERVLLDDESTVINFLETLCYLPLAISQAVSFINNNDISIAKYTDLYKRGEEDIIEVLSQNFDHEGRYKDSKNPVVTT
jgi:hypothetical protein